MVKRAFDLIFATFAVIVLSPLLLPIMLALRLTGEGEVFYRQQRLGRNWQPFGIIKLATMLKDSPNMAGGDISARGDPRILPLGHFLRSTKINELPQLLNIVGGDMSIIGPRPLTSRTAAWYTPDHRAATAHLRPGLSGVGSIIFRDEETLLAEVIDRVEAYRTAIAPHKAALERWYAAHQSFALDLKLIALTALVVVRPNFNLAGVLPELPAENPELKALRARAAR